MSWLGFARGSSRLLRHTVRTTSVCSAPLRAGKRVPRATSTFSSRWTGGAECSTLRDSRSSSSNYSVAASMSRRQQRCENPFVPRPCARRVLSSGRAVALERMRHMLSATETIGNYVGRGRPAFDGDQALRDAIVYQILILGEAAKAVLSADPSIQADLPDVEWSPLVRMRDKVSHHLLGHRPRDRLGNGGTRCTCDQTRSPWST